MPECRTRTLAARAWCGRKRTDQSQLDSVAHSSGVWKHRGRTLAARAWCGRERTDQSQLDSVAHCSEILECRGRARGARVWCECGCGGQERQNPIPDRVGEGV